MRAPEAMLDQLYRDHSAALRQYARRRVGRQQSEDLVQDVYVRMLQDANEITLDCPRAYLFRVAANLAIDIRRRSRLHSHLVDDSAEIGPSAMALETKIENLMALQKLQACLASLSPLRQNILYLKRLRELTNAEIATLLGISSRTVERHLVKVQNELRIRCET